MMKYQVLAIGVSMVLAACGGESSEPTSTGTSTAGAESVPAQTSGTLTIAGEGLPRNYDGGVATDYANLIQLDIEQGRLVAYFGSGPTAFGLTLNLGTPLVVGELPISTGSVVIELGETFEQRVDVRDGRLVVQSVDADTRTVRLHIEGHTFVESGNLPEAFALDATVVAPAQP